MARKTPEKLQPTAPEAVAAPPLTVDYGALERERARMRRWEEAGSPSTEESIDKIRAILTTPKPSPREHWERVLRTPNAPRMAVEYARAALGKSSDEPLPEVLRVPTRTEAGEDWEEDATTSAA